MNQKEINKIADKIKKGIQTTYDEITRSITKFSEKANKGAKEIALKLELPRLEKRKAVYLEKIGAAIYSAKKLDIKDAALANKLKSLFDSVKPIDKEIEDMNKEISSLGGAKKKKAAAKKAATKKKAPAKKKPAAKQAAPKKKPAAKKKAPAKKPAAKKKAPAKK